MNTKVLVVYASKYGSTFEIAARISDILNKTGFEAELCEAIKNKDLSIFDAVIIGSAIYMGSWCKEAADFLTINKDILAAKKVWLFSSGPTGDGDSSEIMKGFLFPDKLKPIADIIKPVDIKFFHGKLDIAKLNFLEKLMAKAIKAPLGDFRNWDEITDWANSCALSLDFDRSK